MAIRFYLDQEACGIEISNNTLARFKPIESCVNTRGFRHPGIWANHLNTRQIVSQTTFEVIRIVEWRDLDRARSKLELDKVIRDDWNLPPEERDIDELANHGCVARILRMYGDRGVTKHRLRARRCHDDFAGSIREWVTQMPEVAIELFVLNLDIRNGRHQLWRPVHHPLTEVDITLAVPLAEDIHDGIHVRLVHREAQPAPVVRTAKTLHLANDTVAVLLLPFPDALDKLLTPEVLAGQPFGRDTLLDNRLRGDASVVGPRKDEDVVAKHPLPAPKRIHNRVIERMADMQRTRDVWWRNRDAVRWPPGTQIWLRVKTPCLQPSLINVGFRRMRLVPR